MRIKIKTERKHIDLAVPNIFALNAITAMIANKNAGRTVITPKLMRVMRKSIKQMKKLHKNWTLADVKVGDETHIILKP